MRDTTIAAAEYHGILDRLQAIEAKLLKLPTITDVDFDVDNYDEIHQVIILAHYDIPMNDRNYYSLRHNTLGYILLTCAQHDLWFSGDRNEDMGEHWYVVRNIGDTWPRKSNAASQIQEPQKCEIP